MRILLALLLILLPINSYAFTAGNTLTRTSNIINVNATNINTLAVLGAGTVTKNSAQAMSPDTYCVQLSPSSTTDNLVWNFLIPCTSSTAYTLSFYQRISAAFGGTMTVTIYDQNDTSILSGPNSVSFTDDGAYHLYTNGAVIPTGTGFSRVTILISGATSGSIYIDSIVGV